MSAQQAALCAMPRFAAVYAPCVRALSGVLLQNVGGERDDGQLHGLRPRLRLPLTELGRDLGASQERHVHVEHHHVERLLLLRAGGGIGRLCSKACQQRVQRRSAVRHGGDHEVMHLQQARDEAQIERVIIGDEDMEAAAVLRLGRAR